MQLLAFIVLGLPGKLWLLFIYFSFKNIFIYLAVSGLSCSTRDLPSSLRHVGSLVVACGV